MVDSVIVIALVWAVISVIGVHCSVPVLCEGRVFKNVAPLLTRGRPRVRVFLVAVMLD